MVREKKSKVDDVVKLRKILDNSSDPNIKALISADEKALDSVRRRLVGDTLRTKRQYDRFSNTYNPLEPRVTVHPKIGLSPRMMTPPPKFSSSITLPEFIPVSTSSTVKSKFVPSRDILFSMKELYEIEKVEVVQPIPTVDSSIPEWQPVEETQPEESLKTQVKSKDDQIPEFEREDVTINSEKAETITDWKLRSLKEESPEETVQFIPVELSESKYQKLSKKQERESKKIQKAKEKEAKRLKKLELKKVKRETRVRDREAKQSIIEQPDIQQTSEKIEFIPIKQKRGVKKQKKNNEDTAEWESYFVEKTLKKPSPKSVCSFKEYTLYKRVTGKQRDRKKTIHFFSKEKPKNGQPARLPDGYQLAVNKKTGIPYLKKKK